LIAVVVLCPYCKLTGRVDYAVVRESRAPEPVFAAGGFHLEPGRGPHGKSLVVCDACDEILDL
jgi:hypothetical protein